MCDKKCLIHMLSGLLIGSALGTVATIIITNKNLTNKFKNSPEAIAENITSLFKIN